MMPILTPGSQHRVRSFHLVAGLMLLAAVVCSACTVRLIADYDEITFNGTAALQEECERLFVALENAAVTEDNTDDLYPAHAERYDDIIVALRVLQTRAESLDKNQIPAEQIQLLLNSIEQMQSVHREKSAGPEPEGFSREAVKVLREPVVQQFRAILTLQEGLKR